MIPGQQVSPSFLREVQNVLQSFYNPSQLQKSGLVAMLALGEERDPAGALRRIFRETIRALKPEEKAPHHSTIWRLYYVLTSRYIEQLSQKEVADELGLSTRQVRRYERLASMLLATALWKQLPVQGQADSAPQVVLPDEETADPANSISTEREQELSWIKSSNPIEISNLTGVISSALKIVSPLIRNAGGNIRYDAPDNLPPITGQISSIKQALLELLTAAASTHPGGRVWVTADLSQQQIRVRVRAFERAGEPGAGGQAAAWWEKRETMGKIEIARELAALSGGALELENEPGRDFSFDATLLLPAADQVAVLAIDDNTDALQLLQRFLSGTRYQLAIAENMEQAFQRIEQTSPQIILLDVMMPGLDGWEVLGRLREHPHTESVPVIVSTILLQEELALSLGAAGFLRKPFTQAVLLATLDQQAALFSKESR